MGDRLVRKGLAIGIIVLFIIITVKPSIGNSNYLDDTNPPVTTISFDPPIPNGENGWYINNVTIELNATDDLSGVNITKYRINSGIWQNYTELFILSEDGDDILIEFYSVDNAGNQETLKQTSIDIDQTGPIVELQWEIWNLENDTDMIEINETAYDKTSGMNRVEFFSGNGELLGIVYGPGPTYIWKTIIDYDYIVRGFIIKRNITDEYVKFFAIKISILQYNSTFYWPPRPIAYDNAGNSAYDYIPEPPPFPVTQYFKWYIFPNDYNGFIGRYYIDAVFKKYPTIGPYSYKYLNSETNTLCPRFLERFPLLVRLFKLI